MYKLFNCLLLFAVTVLVWRDCGYKTKSYKVVVAFPIKIHNVFVSVWLGCCYHQVLHTKWFWRSDGDTEGILSMSQWRIWMMWWLFYLYVVKILVRILLVLLMPPFIGKCSLRVSLQKKYLWVQLWYSRR